MCFPTTVRANPGYPASITKLMTSYIVFKRLRLGLMRLDQRISVSAIAMRSRQARSAYPRARPCPSISHSRLCSSIRPNDIAYVLAEAASGTSQNFVATMNETAKRLGMTATHYANPNGLFEPRQITTARYMRILAATILKEFPEYAHYFSQPSVKVGSRKLANRNSLIRSMPEADGMKTGYICNSGLNLVASATREGRKLVAIVFGARSGKARADLAQLLLIDGFSRARQGTPQKVASLENRPLGALLPTDMTASVCRKSRP